MCYTLLNCYCIAFLKADTAITEQIYITYLRQYQRPPTEPQRAGKHSRYKYRHIIIYSLSVPALKAHTGSDSTQFFRYILQCFYFFRLSLLYFLKILFSVFRVDPSETFSRDYNFSVFVPVIRFMLLKS